MDRKTLEYFAEIITAACSILNDVEYHIDITPVRAILQIHGRYGQYRSFITELIDAALVQLNGRLQSNSEYSPVYLERYLKTE